MVVVVVVVVEVKVVEDRLHRSFSWSCDCSISENKFTKEIRCGETLSFIGAHVDLKVGLTRCSGMVVVAEVVVVVLVVVVVSQILR